MDDSSTASSAKQKIREAAAKGGAVRAATNTKADWAAMGRVGGVKGGKAASAMLTPEQRRAKGFKAGVASQARLTKEEQSRRGRLAAMTPTPIQRSEIGRLGMCTYQHDLRVYNCPKCSKKSAFTEDQWKAYFDGGEFPS